MHLSRMSKEDRLVFFRLLPTGFPALNHTPNMK